MKQDLKVFKESLAKQVQPDLRVFKDQRVLLELLDLKVFKESLAKQDQPDIRVFKDQRENKVRLVIQAQQVTQALQEFRDPLELQV